MSKHNECTWRKLKLDITEQKTANNDNLQATIIKKKTKLSQKIIKKL